MSTNLPYDEKDLLLKVAQGDETAFTRLFEHWHEHLATYIFRITRSKDIAAEIVQDVFLKIWISREALGSVENFGNYLFVVSKNHALNSLRRTIRELHYMKTWEQKIMTENKDSIIRSQSEEDDKEKIMYTLIDEAIDLLPPRQKQVFVLHRYDRLTYLEIAEKLGIGRESVKTHLGLAVKAISKYLTQKTNLLILLISASEKIF